MLTDRSAAPCGNPFGLARVLAAVALLVSACTQGEADAAPERFRVDVEGGVSVARTVGGPLYDAELFTLEPLLTLSQDPDEPESLLFRAGSITIGPDDRYYVADRGNGRIAVFDTLGRFVQAIGREGSGPGEFRGPTVQPFAGDVLSVFDFNLQRESRFLLAGGLLETTRVPGNGLAIGLQRLPDGRLLRYGVESREESEIGWSGRTLTLLSADGADTVWTLATDLVAENRLARVQVADGSWSTLSTDLPFPPVATAAWVPGHGFLLGAGDQPELRWYDLEGRLTRRIVFEPPIHELTAAVKRQYEERLWQQRVAAAERRGRTPTPVRDVVYPDEPGLWSWAVADDAGNVWLLDTWSEELGLDEGRGHRFHVIAADGRYLGTTLAPTVRFQVHGDRLTALVEDPVSGEIVPTVFRIVHAVPGLVYP
ncbi:MAG: 6-bladed beta-propeller [Gemmatimonadota bacterium]|jgi:hypothetical protein